MPQIVRPQESFGHLMGQVLRSVFGVCVCTCGIPSHADFVRTSEVVSSGQLLSLFFALSGTLQHLQLCISDGFWRMLAQVVAL